MATTEAEEEERGQRRGEGEPAARDAARLLGALYAFPRTRQQNRHFPAETQECSGAREIGVQFSDRSSGYQARILVGTGWRARTSRHSLSGCSIR